MPSCAPSLRPVPRKLKRSTGQSEAPLRRIHRLHGVVHDLVVQGAAAQRMGMADHRGESGIGRAFVHHRLKPACRTLQCDMLRMLLRARGPHPGAGGEELDVAVIIPLLFYARQRKSTHRGASIAKLSDDPDKNALVTVPLRMERRTQARLLEYGMLAPYVRSPAP